MKLTSRTEKIRQYLYRIRPISICLVLAGCAVAPSSDIHQEGVVSKQIAALHDELKALRTEVHQLRQALNARPSAPTEAKTAHTVRFDTGATLGSLKAKVALIEFSDYQCPYCGRFHAQTFSQIKQQYVETGKVLYVYRNFPLSFHQEAKPAAIAAACAGKQGAYWPMQQKLYANQAQLGAAYYTTLAQEFKLDTNKFKVCLVDPKQSQEIDADFTYGQQVGVKGTPHFFIGRIEGKQIVDAKSISGAEPFNVFAQVLDGFLK